MNYSVRDHGDRFELDISWDHSDLSFFFDSAREQQTGDIVFDGADVEDIRIIQATGDDIGLLVMDQGDMEFEGRGNYNELVQDLAQQAEYHPYDEPESD